jgi:AraC-like DNA-binding protein
MKKLKEPFFIVPSKVFSLGLTPYELAIVFYLCMRADNEKHTCWPSEKLMARECGMTSRMVRKVLRELEEKNVVSVENHYEMSHNKLIRQTANHYYIKLFDDGVVDNIDGKIECNIEDNKKSLPAEQYSSPKGTVFRPQRNIIPPPEEQYSGEINKTISNKTKINITKSIELRPAESEIERKNKKVFEDLKDECLRALSLEWRVSEDSCEMVNRALIDIWNRGCFLHDGRTYSGDEVCTILCEKLTATRVKRALDAMLERGDEVRLPQLYLVKCIFAELVSPTSDEKKGKSPQNSSFNIDDLFEAALRRSDEVLSKYDTANVGKG